MFWYIVSFCISFYFFAVTHRNECVTAKWFSVVNFELSCHSLNIVVRSARRFDVEMFCETAAPECE